MQLLYESNVVLFVGTYENTNFPENQIIIWDDLRKRKIGVLMLNESIFEIKVSKTAIFAILESKVKYFKDKIIVFEILNLKFLFTINQVNSISKLISFIQVHDIAILAYTNSWKSEEINILKCNNEIKDLVFSNKDGEVVERFDKFIYCFLPSIDRIVLSKKVILSYSG